MKTKSLLVATIGLSFLAASKADADFTYTKINFDEAGPAEVMESLYGGAFAQSGLNFVGAGATAHRIDDAHDQRWTGTYDIKVLARFSGYTQSFGTASNGVFQKLVEAQNIGFDANGASAVVTLDNEPFLRSGNSGTQSSLNSGNKDGRDHVLTYQVESGNASPVWLLFWEDLNLNPNITKGRSSSDYNDLIVMVRASGSQEPNPVAVPLPPAFGVGLATIGLSLWYMRRRPA